MSVARLIQPDHPGPVDFIVMPVSPVRFIIQTILASPSMLQSQYRNMLTGKPGARPIHLLSRRRRSTAARCWRTFRCRKAFRHRRERGHRACYDESKHIGEKRCTTFSIPPKYGADHDVRPLNVPGPGMGEQDYRVLRKGTEPDQRRSAAERVRFGCAGLNLLLHHRRIDPDSPWP